MKNKKRILIIIFAYNAESTIENVLHRISKKTINEASEIIVADDASQDNTSDIARKYKKNNNFKKLKIIKHLKNKGYGGNQKWGYKYAIKHKFDIVVMLHGDAQYPPEYVHSIIEPILLENADFVFGSRMMGHPLKGGMPLYKFFGNKFLTFVENFILHTNLSEFHSGFRAYSIKALKDIPFNKNSDDFHFDSEIIIQLVIAKNKIKEFAIPTRYGIEKCYVNPVFYGLNILKILGQYLLNKLNVRKYEKFNVKNES